MLIVYFIYYIEKKVICSGKGCSKQLLNGAYRIDIKGKFTPNMKDAKQVDRVFHFCPFAKCFTNPKERSNQFIPKLKEDAVIIVDPTITMTAAEKAFLSPLNLLCIGSG